MCSCGGSANSRVECRHAREAGNNAPALGVAELHPLICSPKCKGWCAGVWRGHPHPDPATIFNQFQIKVDDVLRTHTGNPGRAGGGCSAPGLLHGENKGTLHQVCTDLACGRSRSGSQGSWIAAVLRLGVIGPTGCEGCISSAPFQQPHLPHACPHLKQQVGCASCLHRQSQDGHGSKGLPACK